jgi:hypothetical protein
VQCVGFDLRPTVAHRALVRQGLTAEAMRGRRVLSRGAPDPSRAVCSYELRYVRPECCSSPDFVADYRTCSSIGATYYSTHFMALQSVPRIEGEGRKFSTELPSCVTGRTREGRRRDDEDLEEGGLCVVQCRPVDVRSVPGTAVRAPLARTREGKMSLRGRPAGPLDRSRRWRGAHR